MNEETPRIDTKPGHQESITDISGRVALSSSEIAKKQSAQLAQNVRGFWHFIWLFWMQPVRLHQYLLSADVKLDRSILYFVNHLPYLVLPRWRVLFNAERRIVHYLICMWLFIYGAMLIMLITASLFFHIDWGGVKLGMAYGVVLGVAFGLVGGVAFGVAGSTMFSMGYGVAYGMENHVAYGVAFSVAFGVAIGVAGGVAGGVASGALPDKKGLLKINIIFLSMLLISSGLRWYSTGYHPEADHTIPFLFTAYIIFIFTALRIWAYPFECIWQWRSRRLNNLALSPVNFHQLSYFPLPYLERQIVDTAETNPDLALNTLKECQIAPGQRDIYRRALAQIQVKQLRTLWQAQDYEALKNLRDEHGWLGGLSTQDELLLNFAVVCSHMDAAQALADSPELACRELEKAEQECRRLKDNALSSKVDLARLSWFEVDKNVLGRYLLPLLDEVHARLSDELAATQKKIPRGITNPFTAGTPLKGDNRLHQFIFRGREAVIKQIDGLLVQNHEAFPLALTGARRVGKSSLLAMLPTKLPNALIINCDLQNSASTSFYRNIIEQWAQVCVPRGISLPAQLMEKIPDSPEAFNQWMHALEDSLSRDNGWHSGAARIERIIFCLDEFERLEELFTGDDNELKRLAGVLRAITQHLTRVRLIMITELPHHQWSPLWQDHLIHCREIRLPYLSQQASVELLHQPLPDFPPTAIPRDIAEYVYRQCRGQPYLLQCIGYELVRELNLRQNANTAKGSAEEPAVVDQALAEEVVEGVSHSAGPLFNSIWRLNFSPRVRQALYASAHGQQPPLDALLINELQRHGLLIDGNTVGYPVILNWIREHVLRDGNEFVVKD